MLVAFGLVLFGLLGAHLPFARALLLDRTATWLRGAAGIELSASSLSYNLLSLSAELRDVKLAATGAEDEPFATADVVALDFGFRMLLGRIDLRRITVESPSLAVRREADGSGNLPDTAGSGAAAPPTFTLPDISVEDLALEVVLPGVAVRMQGAAFELTSPSAGVIDFGVRATTGLAVAFGGTSIAVESADARARYDGAAIVITAFTAARPDTSIRATGTIGVAGEAPQIDLAFEGATDLESWTSDAPDGTRLAGRVEGRGRVTGPLSSPVVSADLAGEDLAWSTIEISTARVNGTFRDGVLDIDTLTGRLAGGAVDGSGRISLGSQGGASVVTARWSDVTIAALLERGALKSDVSTSGTSTVEWERAGDAGAIHSRASIDTRLASGDEAASLRLRTTSRGPNWRIDIESTDDDPDAVRAGADLLLDDQSWTDSAVRGAVSLTSPDARRVLRRLEALGVPFGGFDVSTVSGTAVLAATLGGTVGALEITGDLDGQSVAIAGSPEVDLATTVAIDLGNGTWQGTFQTGLADLAPWADARRPELGLRGGLTVTGTWSGALADPVATVELAGQGLSVIGVDVTELTARGLVSLATIELVRADLRGASGGTLRAEGRIDPSTGHLSLTLNGSDITAMVPARPADENHAAVFAGASVTAVVEGTLTDLSGQATLAIRSVRVSGQDLGAVDAGVTFADGSAAMLAGVPELGTSLEATVELTAPYTFAGRGAMDSSELVRLLGAAGVTFTGPEDVTGLVTASVEFSGDLDDLSEVTATVTVTPADVALFGVPVHAVEDLEATVGGGRVRLGPGALLVGDVSLGITADLGTGAPDGDIALTLDGDLGSLVPWLTRIDGLPWTVDGRVTAALDATRSAAGLSVTGTVESAIAGVRHGEEPIAENLQIAIDLDQSRAHLRRLTGSVLSGEADITASAPLTWLNEWLPAGAALAGPASTEPGVLEGTATFDVAAALTRAGVTLQQELGGTVTVLTRLSADTPTLEAFTGEITVERGEMTTLSRTFAQYQPTVLRIADRRLTIEIFDWRGSSGDVTGSGVIGLAPDVDTNVSFVFDTNLRLLDTFLPGRATGAIRGSVDVSGRPGAWQVATESTLENASWLLPESRLFFAEWSGRFALSDDAIVVSALEGQLNGGTITVSGRLPFGPGAEGDGLTIAAREILLDIPRGLHSQAIADLRWTPRNGGSVLAGTITLTANRYREPVTRMLEMVDALAASSRASAESGGLPDWLSSASLDVALGVTDPVVLDNSLGTIEFVPDLRLTGTIGDPALAGDIGVLDDGRISIGGRRYRLRESRLRFVPAEGLAPTLDIVGETRVGDYDVVLRISGTPDRIETTFSSSPPLSERDLRSLLVTGQIESAGEASGEFALEAASTDILGFAGKFVGLDSVRLGAADLDIVSKDARTAQHLTVSKSFGRMFELIFSENLEDGPLTWVVVWKPVTGYEFRFASVENTQTTVEFRQELLFGPGTTRLRSGRRATTAAPQPQIADVEIVGSPGFDEAEILDVLRLKPGQRFDIRKWIDDRMRLEKLYRDRDFHRIRIVPTRIERDRVDDTRRLALRYNIDRGPRTVIEVAGDDLPGAALEEMHEQWGGVPIADVLREEFERIARLELARRGYLQATVTAEFPTVTDELEQAVLTVDRGPRTRRQAIAWSGNRAVTAPALDALIADLPPASSPFVDPSAAVRRVTDRYAEQGFFTTEVVVRPPAFDGDAATLPIEIVEGVESRVAAVALGGVAPSRIDAARAALDLPEGATFGSRTTIDAQRRLEGFYADLGYRDAKITYSVDRSPEGPVAVAMTVDEGLPHVVDDVRISGVERYEPRARRSGSDNRARSGGRPTASAGDQTQSLRHRHVPAGGRHVRAVGPRRRAGRRDSRVGVDIRRRAEEVPTAVRHPDLEQLHAGHRLWQDRVRRNGRDPRQELPGTRDAGERRRRLRHRHSDGQRSAVNPAHVRARASHELLRARALGSHRRREPSTAGPPPRVHVRATRPAAPDDGGGVELRVRLPRLPLFSRRRARRDRLRRLSCRPVRVGGLRLARRRVRREGRMVPFVELPAGRRVARLVARIRPLPRAPDALRLVRSGDTRGRRPVGHARCLFGRGAALGAGPLLHRRRHEHHTRLSGGVALGDQLLRPVARRPRVARPQRRSALPRLPLVPWRRVPRCRQHVPRVEGHRSFEAGARRRDRHPHRHAACAAPFRLRVPAHDGFWIPRAAHSLFDWTDVLEGARSECGSTPHELRSRCDACPDSDCPGADGRHGVDSRQRHHPGHPQPDPTNRARHAASPRRARRAAGPPRERPAAPERGRNAAVGRALRGHGRSAGFRDGGLFLVHELHDGRLRRCGAAAGRPPAGPHRRRGRRPHVRLVNRRARGRHRPHCRDHGRLGAGWTSLAGPARSPCSRHC